MLLRPRTLARRVRRAVLARRRLLAAALAALAVATAMRAQASPPPSLTGVLAAAHDLPAGATLTRADLTRVPVPPGSVPGGALATPADAVGRTTVGPVQAGEPLTDVRLLGGSLLERFPGAVAAPVRIGDRASVGLLRVGDRVDLYAADPQGAAEPVVAARDVPVLALPAGRAEGPGLAAGALIVVAVPEETALRLAGFGVSAFLSVVLVR